MSRPECIYTYLQVLTGTFTHTHHTHTRVSDLRGDIGYHFMEAEIQPCAALKTQHKVIYRHSHTDERAIILAIRHVPTKLCAPISSVTHPVLAASPLGLG